MEKHGKTRQSQADHLLDEEHCDWRFSFFSFILSSQFVTQADHLLDEEHCVVHSRFSDFLSPSHMWHFSVGDFSGTLDGMFDLAHREFMNM